MKKVAVILLAIVLVVLLVDLAWTGFQSESPEEIQCETYHWRNYSASATEPLYMAPDDALYQPITLKIADNIEAQTGISLQKVVEQGGEIIFNFFYTGTSPTITGYCDLVEVIILTENGKIIEDFILRYTEDDLIFDTV